MAEKFFYDDEEMQDELVRFLVNDRDFLKQCSHLVSVDDFKKFRKEGEERVVVVGVALNFWRKYRDPIGAFLRSEAEREAKQLGFTAEKLERLSDFCKEMRDKNHRFVAADIIAGKLKTWKYSRKIALLMEEVHGLALSGKLTPDVFLEKSRRAVDGWKDQEAQEPVDILSDEELETRILRREHQKLVQRHPVLLIDPLDAMIRIIARGQLGLVIAPWSRGKTLFFVHSGLAYALQRQRVLHVTLEDPRDDIEDRYDAGITNLPIQQLVNLPEKVRERFKAFQKIVRGRIKVIDGTEGGMSIEAIENIWEQQHNRGFTADVVLIDYDDEIKPPRKQTDRRFEFADIYREFRQFLGRHSLIGWTAAQTGRATEDMKILRGKEVAEDISKIRKATLALSLGKGDWGEDSIYLWVARHRYDIQHVGCNIMTDKARSSFYDREATLLRRRAEIKAKKKSDDDDDS